MGSNESWRPKNWENPYHRDLDWDSSELYPATYKTMCKTFEAGADAMLKVLKEEMNKILKNTGG